MDSLEELLQNLGFNQDYIKAIQTTESFDSHRAQIPEVEFMDFEPEIVSTNQMEVTIAPTSNNSYFFNSLKDNS